MPFENNKMQEISDSERWLDRCFAAYRQACPDPEPGPNFMPELWRAIDARRRFAFSFGRWARGMVTAAAALAMLMAIFVAVPSPQVSPVYVATYLDTLAADNPADNPAYTETMRQDSSWERNIQ